MFSFDVLSDFKVWLYYNFDLFQLFRVKIEKEKKKVAQEAGFLRTEVTGGEVRELYLVGQWQMDRDAKCFNHVDNCGCLPFNGYFRWLKKQKEREEFSSYKCVRYWCISSIIYTFLNLCLLTTKWRALLSFYHHL